MGESSPMTAGPSSGLPSTLLGAVVCADPEEHDAIVAMAREVYSDLGDYGVIIPSWFAHPGVEAFVERVEGAVVSFSLIGGFEPLESHQSRLIVDVLAIGVHPLHRRRGSGRRHLRNAIDRAVARAQGFDVAEMRLTVSSENGPACRLFSSEGFAILDLHHGTYARGQQAIRMHRPL